ncbi:LLM class flavin-dependent oxidoreductase [Streptomyces sp. L7]
MVTTLKSAFSGEPFSYRGRTVRVTPAPYRPGGPAVLLGGSSEPAARRAARIADGFVPSVPEVWEHCRDEVARLGPPRPRPQPDRAEPGGRPRRGPRRGLGADGAVLPARDQRLRGLAAQDDVAAPFRTGRGAGGAAARRAVPGAGARAVRTRTEGRTTAVHPVPSAVRGACRWSRRGRVCGCSSGKCCRPSAERPGTRCVR